MEKTKKNDDADVDDDEEQENENSIHNNVIICKHILSNDVICISCCMFNGGCLSLSFQTLFEPGKVFSVCVWNWEVWSTNCEQSNQQLFLSFGVCV